MKTYLDLIKRILAEGEWKENRTGERALTIAGAHLSHRMAKGFPLLTTKKMAWKNIKVELEFFIKGLTDKRWLQERGCHIWDEWCSPTQLLSGLEGLEGLQGLEGDAKKQRQREVSDLGPIYGKQWRDFGGVDQLKEVVAQLHTNPQDRRMVVSSWNPPELAQMALPPCHVLFHLTAVNNTLHLAWFQRSVDVALGLPFNLASYALLLHLLAKEAQLEAGTLHGFLSDVHIYESHAAGLKKQLQREPLPLPTITTEPFKDLFNWEHGATKLNSYRSHEKIEFPILV